LFRCRLTHSGTCNYASSFCQPAGAAASACPTNWSSVRGSEVGSAFRACDNTLLLAEGHGVGTTDLRPRGVPIEQGLYRYEV
jgi:hypothetical protein